MSKAKSRRGKCFLCGATSINVCHRCHLVHFCSKDHFRWHHQRDYCFPFKIVWYQIGDLHNHSVVATRDIKPLELLLFERNVVSSPSFISSNSCCITCLKEPERPDEPYRQCLRCPANVCNVDCAQKLSLHMCECAEMAANFEVIEEMIQMNPRQFALVVSTFRLLQAREQSGKVYDLTKVLECRNPYYSNKTDTKESSWAATERLDVINAIQVLSSRFQKSEIALCVDIVRSASFPMKGKPSGSLLFPLLSLVQHSCLRNSKYVIYPNNSVALMAQTFIREGEEITTSFVNTLEPTWKRRARLFRDHLIICSCVRCRDPTELGTLMSALTCSKCEDHGSNNYILPTSPLDNEDCIWQCPVHPGSRMEAKNVIQLTMDIELTMLRGPPMKSDELDGLRRHAESILHPQHAALVNFDRHSLTKGDSSRPRHRANLIKTTRVCDRLLTLINRLEPGFPDVRGEILDHMAAAELNLAKLNLEEGTISRPQFLTRVKTCMIVLQEATRCKSCVRVDRSSQQISQDLDALEDSSYLSDSSCASLYD